MLLQVPPNWQGLTKVSHSLMSAETKNNVQVFFDISLSTFILNQEYRSFTCWWCKTYQYHNEHLSILLDRYNWRFRCDCHMWHHSCKDFCPLHTHYNLQHMQVICTLRGKLPKLSMLLVKKISIKLINTENLNQWKSCSEILPRNYWIQCISANFKNINCFPSKYSSLNTYVTMLASPSFFTRAGIRTDFVDAFPTVMTDC